MDKAQLNEAMVVLLENVQSIFKCTILLLEKDSLTESEKKSLVETMRIICDNLNIVKDAIKQMEYSIPKKIKKEDNIIFGKN